MIVVMDMSSGKIYEDEFGRYEDEVLNAGWLPPQPELQLELQGAVSAAGNDREIDPEAYLASIYRAQA